MEKFKYIEKNQLNNKMYYLIGNYHRVLVMNSSELKNKIKSQEYKVIGLEIQNNKIIETVHSSNYIERDLFYFTLCEKINQDCSDYSIMGLLLEKLKEINRRKNQFQNDKELVKDIIIMIKRFFNYLGKTKYTFFKTKYSEMIFLRYEELENNISYKIIDRELNNFIQDGTISNWKQNRDKDIYSFKELCSCLDTLYLAPYSEDRKNKIEIILNIFIEFFGGVKYNYLGNFLYNFYLFALSDACMYSVENQVDLQIPQINEQDRIEMLDKSAGYTENVYNHNRQMIVRNSQKFNQLVHKYQSDIRDLFYSLKNVPSIQSGDLKNLQECLNKYIGVVENKYDEILQRLVAVCNKNRSLDTLRVIGNFKEFNEYTNIPILKNIGLAFTTVGFGRETLNFVKEKLEICLNDNLSDESRQMLEEYISLSNGLKGVLFYVLDSLRLSIIDKYKIEKRKKLKLYSDNSVVPLLYSLFIFPSIWETRMHSRHVVLVSYQKKLEIAWLTTNYIMCEKVDRRIEEVSVNNATVSWNYFVECLKIKDNDLDIEMLTAFRNYLFSKWDWEIEDKKLNLYYFLKESKK